MLTREFFYNDVAPDGAGARLGGCCNRCVGVHGRSRIFPASAPGFLVGIVFPQPRHGRRVECAAKTSHRFAPSFAAEFVPGVRRKVSR